MILIRLLWLLLISALIKYGYYQECIRKCMLVLHLYCEMVASQYVMDTTQMLY